MRKKILPAFISICLLLTIITNLTMVSAAQPVYFFGSAGVNYNGYTVSASGAEMHHHSLESKKDGKWYYEETINYFTGRFEFGIINDMQTTEIIYYICVGNQFRRWNNRDTTLKSVNIGLKNGDVVGIALDADNNKVEFFKNGVSIYILNDAFTNFVQGANAFRSKTGTGGSALSSYDVTYNFGQSAFKYAIPAGYKPFIETRVTGVSVSPQAHAMNIGETFTLGTQVTPADATNKEIVWASGNNAIATVDSNGVVTAVSVGQTSITATANNGISDTCTITVVEPADTSGRLAVFLETGETMRLCVSDDVADNLNFLWSTDSSIADVSTDGVVTGVSAGMCNVIVQGSSGFEQTLAVRVVDAEPVLEPEVIKVNDHDTNIKYSGIWHFYGGDPTFYGNDEQYSNQADACAEFTFIGTGIRWIAATSNNLGICDIYVDGVLQVQGMDLYSDNLEPQKVLFSKSNLIRGEHKIKIVVTGEKNALATDSHVTIDAFEYEA